MTCSKIIFFNFLNGAWLSIWFEFLVALQYITHLWLLDVVASRKIASFSQILGIYQKMSVILFVLRNPFRVNFLAALKFLQ